MDALVILLACLFAPIVNVVKNKQPVPPVEGRASAPETTTVDLFDAKSNRVGYAVHRGNGSVDVFAPDGTRLGYTTPRR